MVLKIRSTVRISLQGQSNKLVPVGIDVRRQASITSVSPRQKSSPRTEDFQTSCGAYRICMNVKRPLLACNGNSPSSGRLLRLPFHISRMDGERILPSRQWGNICNAVSPSQAGSWVRQQRTNLQHLSTVAHGTRAAVTVSSAYCIIVTCVSKTAQPLRCGPGSTVETTLNHREQCRSFVLAVRDQL